MNYYEVYRSDSGELVAKGTARECRKQLGCASVDSFYTIVGQSLKGKYNKYKVVKMTGGQAALKNEVKE